MNTKGAITGAFCVSGRFKDQGCLVFESENEGGTSFFRKNEPCIFNVRFFTYL